MLRELMYDSKIPSDIRYIEPTVTEIICCFQKDKGVPDEDDLFELKVMLNDLLINAISHGNKGEVNKYVKISAGLTKRRYAFIQVEDEGEGYDYKAVLMQNKISIEAKSMCDIMENGRGMLIISNLCDKIKYNKKGNKIQIYKKLSKPNRGSKS